MKKSFVIHPFLLAILPIVFLCSHNIEQVSPSQTLLPSAIMLGFTILLVLLLWLILRDGKKTGIIVSIFLVLFFSYGHILEMIQNWQIKFLGQHKCLMPIWGMLLIFTGYLVIRTRRNLHNFTYISNIISLTLVAISLINIGVYEFRTRGISADIWKGAWEYNKSAKDNENKLRDIYYVILDGYASSSTLNELYNYDNHEFTDSLTEKGFYVASESVSNYGVTLLSLASSLNMEYVNYLRGIKSKGQKVPYQKIKNSKVMNLLIKNSKVMNLLKSKGYKFVHFSSGWGPTDTNEYADYDFKCGRSDEFLMVLIQTTLLDCFANRLIGDDARTRALRTFSRLAKVHRIQGPKFVFAHFLQPHPPYIFDANGKKVPGAELKLHGKRPWHQKQNYLNQLIFVSKKVKALVDEILLESTVQPIIILQADHGSASTFHTRRDDWLRPNKTNLRERFRIFNAYYLPAGGNTLLYDSISPVNSFRVIFNFYFDQHYELLDDQSYHSTYAYPYALGNVTKYVVYD